MIRTGSLLAALALSVSLAQAAPLTITTYLEPGADDSTFWDVNNSGTAVGYSTTGGVSRAMTWTEAGGFVSLSGPATATYSVASGISDGGVIVGSWGNPTGGRSGFILNGSGYSTFDIAGATETNLRAISPDGRYITGYYSNPTTDGQGFVLDTSTGTLTYIGAGGNDLTIAQGVSNGGVVVGSDVLRDDLTGAGIGRPGFTFDLATATRTNFDLPGMIRTAFRAIDEFGVISGWTIDGAGVTQGFTGGPVAPDYFSILGGVQTFVEGSNNAGWLTGTVYLAADGSSRAFIAKPVPLPATAWLVLIGLTALGAGRRRTRA